MSWFNICQKYDCEVIKQVHKIIKLRRIIFTGIHLYYIDTYHLQTHSHPHTCTLWYFFIFASWHCFPQRQSSTWTTAQRGFRRLLLDKISSRNSLQVNTLALEIPQFLEHFPLLFGNARKISAEQSRWPHLMFFLGLWDFLPSTPVLLNLPFLVKELNGPEIT